MSERILVGHFLTRHAAARRAGIPADEVVQRPDLLRVGGRFLEEVYFEFQFNGHGIRRDLGSVVEHLRWSFDDEVVADWLARPNETLGQMTPLGWIAAGNDGWKIADAARHHGPIPDGDER